MQKKAIIFGASGQDGGYLEELFCREGIQFASTSRHGSPIRCDVGDFHQVESLIKSQRPDYIFQLAANSTTRHDVTLENQRSIVDGSLNVLEAVKRHVPEARVFLTGSALQFENTGKPINEFTPFEASSSYSSQRIASVYMARYYREKQGVRVYVGYFFHHDSPRRGVQHVAQKIAQGAIRIASGEKTKLEVDNIGVYKEWTFAGDAMEAIWKLVNQEMHYESIIGSGEIHSIREWTDLCFKLVDLDWKDHVIISNDSNTSFPFVADPTRLFAMGWKPKVSFRDLAELMTVKMAGQKFLK